jgi:two-component system NtrC family response regulator
MTSHDTKLLIVDDDAGLRRQLAWVFDDQDSVDCGSLSEVRSALETHATGVVLLDLGLPPDPNGPGEGMAALKEILRAAPQAKVIVLTGQRDRAYAREAIQLGAYDHYEKPIDEDEIRLVVDRARKVHALEAENAVLGRTPAEPDGLRDMIGASARMVEVGQQVARLAGSDLAVLINGESGTGKELVARNLHDLSARANGPLVPINCAAIPENLLESELFGHEKGAFTGAHKTTRGKIEEAHGGTLLLDEVGEIPVGLQAKLLRVLQERSIERIGARKPVEVDFRLVCATNRDLSALVAQGGFREDLYYRIAEATLEVPPLRERPEDIVPIARQHLEQFARSQGIADPGFTKDAIVAMNQHDWPGNVRELQSRIKQAAVCSTGAITPADLKLAEPVGGQIPAGHDLKTIRKLAEYNAVRSAITAAGGNVAEAARRLNISRPTLYQLLDEHKLR